VSALVQVRGDAVLASSLDVARSFDKRHADVLRSVVTLLKSCPDLERNFALMIDSFEAGKGSTRQRHCYEMDRKGFTLLAMGFTGPKALEWKIAYIDAFDRMEAALRAAVNDDEEEDMLPAVRPAADSGMAFVERMKFEPPNIQLAYVREMRMARGRPGAIMAMRELGWEQAEDTGPEQVMAASNPVIRQVLQWVQDRTMAAPGNRIRTMTMYNDFVRWCADLGAEVLSLPAFGRSLGALGYPSRRSNATYRDGLKLRD
jgi:Rha family phage regulatory protein